MSTSGTPTVSCVGDLDELEILTATSATLATPPPMDKLQSRVTIVIDRKRARTLSQSTPKNVGVGIKKPKLEQKKSTTIVLNLKRVAIDASRRRWLHRHRALFTPLLPSSSTFFSTLAKEVEASCDTNPYKPMDQMEKQPKSIKGGELKDYQLQGLSFLAWTYTNGTNCILGDEMGLGKTLQTLSLFAYIAETSQGTVDPHLVICPLSVLSSWAKETEYWFPSFRVMRFHGARPERENLKKMFVCGENEKLRYDLCITTYEAYVAEDTWFKSRRWTYCVLDEGHRIKNSETVLAHKVQGIGSLYRLVLTGTPIQNNLVELWGILHWLYPAVFTKASEKRFNDAFSLSAGSYDLSFLAAAKKLLSKIMLRRTKAVVEATIPPRDELTVFVPLTEAQRFWYYRLLTRMDTLDLEQIFGAVDEGGDRGRKEAKEEVKKKMESADSHQYRKLMNLLLQLRRLCDHPYLLKHAEPDPYINGEHLVASSSKLIVIDKLLADVLPHGEQVLIFSQWTSMLDCLEDFMALRKIPYARLDGSTPRARRTLDIKMFQRDSSPHKVFLISTKAGGLGINLTKATTVIMCDSDWNPQNDLQAIARAHRIGQTKVVKVYRLICQGSVEDMMLDRLRRKLYLSVKVMGSDNTAAQSTADLGLKELLDILRKGSSALSFQGMDLAKFLKADIQEILDLSRSRDSARDAKIHSDNAGEADERLVQDAEEEQRNLLSGVAQVQCRLFEDRVVQRQYKGNATIANEWQAIQKRAQLEKTVLVNGVRIASVHVASVAATPSSLPQKQKKPKFEWEDWCVWCRDGGTLLTCTYCPRVFHPKCDVRGQGQHGSISTCPQHACADCDRGCNAVGGMLFRCRTCFRSFCEDCLPLDDVEPIGDVLPEFLVLGYGERSSTYYIKCHRCIDRFAVDPQFKLDWDTEIREAKQKLSDLP